MSKVIILFACVVFVLFSSNRTVAQYSSEAFELKKASDLYDERGYGESSSITVDGSLVVSNSTGVPSYVYPISHHTISGFPLDVSLNYAGSVSFTTFNTYSGGGAPGFNWSKFQQNRPAWILGVNGFAIQVLHNALSFHCNPAVNLDLQNKSMDMFYDDRFVWLIDGYNFCNAMTNFADPGAAQESQFVDAIRLLRSDGSVLELINQVSASEYDANDVELFTGYYAVNEANAQGYAIVEFDDEYWPDHVQVSAGLDPTSDNSHVGNLRPRKVRYFPGDGLEYVFQEWVMPYGSFSYNNNWGIGGLAYGSAGYTPSIFYLDELRSPAGRLTSFRRSKHYPPEVWKKILGKEEDETFDYKDSTRGRALITGFDGHEIEYLDNGMIINALGRTTKIEFHKVSVEGSNLERYPNTIGNMHLAEYGYAFNPRTGAENPVAAVFATRPDVALADGAVNNTEDPKFRSYLGQVTRIVDPEGRVTRFDYDGIRREYKKYRFPRIEPDPDGSDPALRLENLRLTSITEPTAHYDLCYQIQSDEILVDPSDYLSCEYEGTGVPMVTVHRPGIGEEYDPYKMNDVVHHVNKTFCGEMLSKTEYDFTFGIDEEGGQYTESSRVDVYDYKDNDPISLKRAATDFYRSTYLDNAVPGLPRKRFTGASHTQESAIEVTGVDVDGDPIVGGVILKQDTWIDYPADPETYFGHEYVVLPTGQSVSVNDKQKSDNKLRYEFETVREYYDGAGSLLSDRTATFGTGLKAKEEVLRDNGQDVLIKRTDYLNITYDPEVLASRPCGELDKLATLKNYFQAYPDNKDTDPKWEEVMYDPSIAVYLDGDDASPVPPVFGLSEEVAMLVPDPLPGDPDNRRYLGGQKVVYGTPEETEIGGDIEGQTELIGRVLKEQQVPEDDPNGVDAVTISEYEYLRMNGEDCRLVPFRTTNANGAVTEMQYKVTDQNPGSPGFDWPNLTLLHNNDDITTHQFNPPLFFSLQFEKPLELSSTVRKMLSNGVAVVPGEEDLKTFNHPTYYGLTQGTVDANGWYSRFDYDMNGRIRRAILPYDYRPTGAAPYTGIEEIPLVGHTGKSATKMDLICDNTQASYSAPYTEVDIYSYQGLTASWWKYPKVPQSECPCVAGQEKEEEVQSVQAEECDKTISFSTEEKTVGSIIYTPVADNPSTPEDETSPILLAQTLEDAKLRLVLTEMQGECAILRVTCPELELDYRRTFGPCRGFDDRGNPPTASRTQDGKGDGGNAIQSDPDPGCQAETEVLEETKGLVVDIPLSTEELLDVAANTVLTFRFEVYSPNTSVSFAQASPDSRPRLVLDGTFSNTKKDDVDYTLLVEYDDRNLKSSFTSKIDDYLHTENTYIPTPGNPTAFNGTGADAFAEPYRRATAQHRFGADYRILETKELLKNWDNTPVSSPSIVTYDYTGNGLTLEVVDQVGNATSTEYDPAGRASATTLPGIDVYEDANSDANDDNPGVEVAGDVESKYFIDNDNLNNAASGAGEYDPSSFGVVDLSDQDFQKDYAEVTVNVDENGVQSGSVKDALGNLRREVFATYGGVAPYRWVKYDYDVLNRLTKVTNAEHQVTEYTYDRFGRVLYKSQQDMGISSYAYDRLGNTRFTQTEEQYADEKLTFYQYDDLNRLTLVGEAQFLPDHISSIKSEEGGADPEKSGEGEPQLSSGPSRLTDQLADQTHYLHLNPGAGHPLTYNPSLWDNVINSALQPSTRVKDIPFKVEVACSLGGTSYDESAPLAPYLMAPVTNYDPIPVTSSPTLYDFENAARYPNHTRMVIQYDELPPLHGAVWGGFPAHSLWNQLMPPRPDWFDEDNNPNTTTIQKVRNTKGREVAVAYRDHSGEPYHYTVSSYDPRGRVEAIVHYTENVGFDAVYYEYNSLNLITKIRTVDPFRQHTTWYGYDNNGRLDSVWTMLSAVGTGLAGPTVQISPVLAPSLYPVHDEPRPPANKVDIVYSYDQRGRVERKRLQADPVAPGVNITVDYDYNKRGWLEDMTAVRNGTNLFSMNLEYDQAGQILKQTSQQGTVSSQKQHYEYDDVRQLKKWIRNKNTGGMTTETYLYDNIGNRENRSHSTTGAMTYAYPKNGCSPNPADPNYCGDIVGPNRLTQTQTFNGMGALQYTNHYVYDMNGAIATNTRVTPNGTKTEEFTHSYRSLLWKYATTTLTGPNTSTSDWRYRYNPRGEREQRRLYSRTPLTDFYSGYAWTYYILDGQNRQLAVWNGLQTSKPTACPGGNPPPPTGSWRYLYPSEYLTYGLSRAADVITRPTAAPNGVKEFKITDHLGSTRVAIKEPGTTQRWDYEPYGDPVAGVPPRKGFIDKEVDKESDLGDFGVRKYDDEIGRFLSADPLFDHPDQVDKSPYAYAWNDPVSLSDPEGECPICPFLAKFALGAGIEYVTQVADNLAEGKPFTDAVTDVKLGKIIVAGAAELIPGGGVGRKIVVEASESVVGNIASDEEVTVKGTLIDVASGVIGDKIAEKVPLPADIGKRSAEAHRSQNIANAGRPRPAQAARAHAATNHVQSGQRANNLTKRASEEGFVYTLKKALNAFGGLSGSAIEARRQYPLYTGSNWLGRTDHPVYIPPHNR